MLFRKSLMIVSLICYLGPTFLQASESSPSETTNNFLEYAAECMTPSDQPGKCMPITSCRNAFALFQNIQQSDQAFFERGAAYLKQSQCNYKDEVPFVCCPKEEIQMNPVVREHLEKLNCGVHYNYRIANGNDSFLLNFRWTAMLLYENNEGPVCSGALIDERHVLTATHCLHNFVNLPFAVRLGEYNRSSEVDCTIFRRKKRCLEPVEDIEIDEIIPYDGYIYKGIQHDITLLRLKRSVKFGDGISPICLPITEELQMENKENYTVAGWGQTEDDKKVSDVLRFTPLPVRSNEFCSKKLQLRLTDENICAGGEGFHDSCKGDSGGAVFRPGRYVDEVFRQIQYGIVSAGITSCGKSTYPGIYTNVSHYLQWITDHMKIDDNKTES